MPKTKISEFSATPANNTDIDSINIAEGCAPSGINDAIRELMAQLKDFQTGAVGDSFNGPVGTTTSAAGAFTTLSASSTVSGTGFSTYLASPPAIGGTAAAAGAFTTLSASGAVTLSGGTANGVAYLNGSKVVTSGSALTFSGQQFAISSLGDQIKISNSVGNQLLTLSSNSAGSVFTSHDGTSFVPILWQSNTAEQMRLTSTGLGIGTSSPSQKLEVIGGAAIVGTSPLYLQRPVIPSFNGQGAPSIEWRFYSTGTTYTTGAYIQGLAEDAWTSTSAPTGIRFYTVPSGSTTLQQRLHLDSSGNLGLGVTPDALSFPFTSSSLQFAGGNSIYPWSGAGMYFQSNAYYNSSWKYKTTNPAGQMVLSIDGSFVWNRAASGTAGNAITFTQAMTLDASGNLAVGSTSNSDGRIKVDATSGTSIVTAVWAKNNAGSSAGTYVAWNAATTGNNLLMDFYTEASPSLRGSISFNRGAGVIAYNVTSDYRSKDIIGSVNNSGALIDSVPVYMGKMKGATQERPMFIAHETPAYAHTGEKDAVDADGNPVYQQMDASALIPVMWAEIQSLRQRVAQLESN